jgi:putative transposase
VRIRWGAPRIHGELLKLGIDIGETSVAKYIVRRRKPPSQTWRTFLENHVRTTVSVDFFTVPTIRFQALYVFLVLAHDRRRIVHFNVTAHPTAEWTAQQLLMSQFMSQSKIQFTFFRVIATYSASSA